MLFYLNHTYIENFIFLIMERPIFVLRCYNDSISLVKNFQLYKESVKNKYVGHQ